MEQLVNHVGQQENVIRRLEEAEQEGDKDINPETGIRYDAKLKVHIVDA